MSEVGRQTDGSLRDVTTPDLQLNFSDRFPNSTQREKQHRPNGPFFYPNSYMIIPHRQQDDATMHHSALPHPHTQTSIQPRPRPNAIKHISSTRTQSSSPQPHIFLSQVGLNGVFVVDYTDSEPTARASSSRRPPPHTPFHPPSDTVTLSRFAGGYGVKTSRDDVSSTGDDSYGA